MFVTEDVARNKWCPHVRFAAEQGGSYNRGTRDPMNSREINDNNVPRCIASDCMMWALKPEKPDEGKCGFAQLSVINGDTGRCLTTKISKELIKEWEQASTELSNSIETDKEYGILVFPSKQILDQCIKELQNAIIASCT